MVHVGIGDVLPFTVLLLLLGDRFAAGHPVVRRGYHVLLGVTLLAAGALVGRIIVHTVLVPPGWDYQALWLYGHVADSGMNPYLPAPYHALAGPGPFVEDFGAEVLDVGAVYPPPTLLLFATIGWMPLRVAIVPWMIVQVSAFLFCVLLLWQIFFPGRQRDKLALVLALALLLPATHATFFHGQINFLAVLCVLVAWRMRDRALSGAYFVGAAVVKLMYGALWLYPLLRRQWRAVAGTVVAGLVACLVSLLAFGAGTFATYLRDNPVVHRMPTAYFSTFVNQSLLGAALRLVPYANSSTFGPPVHDPLYLATSVLVGLVTVWLVVRQPRTADGEDISLVLLILMGMLIYPWTLSNYFVVLLIPIAYLWSRWGGLWWTLVVLAAVYPVTHVANGLYSIVASGLLWGTMVVLAARQVQPLRHG
jgi:Glycosyltransferase family 87